MIAVDTNVLAYLLIPSSYTEGAKRVLQKDPLWIAPSLWRSELRNLLLGYLRRSQLTFADANAIMEAAEIRLMDGDVPVESTSVLALAASSGCTAYDCEFIAAAQDSGVPLVTADGKLLSSFPQTAISLSSFAPV